MITKKLLEDEWIPALMGAFFAFMPKIKADYPKIYVATKRTLKKTINDIAEQTRTLIQAENDINDVDVMFISGQIEDAILIVLENISGSDEKEAFLPFAHNFWHELGRFYAIYTEPEDWEYAFDEDDFEELDYLSIEQRAYNFWIVFIAEAIANYVSDKLFNKLISESKENKEHKAFDVKGDNGAIAHADISVLLNAAFSAEGYVDERALGLYFGMLLAGNFFVKKDNSSELSKPVQGLLSEIKKLLETQLKKKEFWKMPETRLRRLGGFIHALELLNDNSPFQRAMKQREEMFMRLLAEAKNNAEQEGKVYKPQGRKTTQGKGTK